MLWRLLSAYVPVSVVLGLGGLQKSCSRLSAVHISAWEQKELVFMQEQIMCIENVASLGRLGGLAVGAGRSVWLAWLARLAGLCLEAFPLSGVFIFVSLELPFFLFFLLLSFLHVCSLQLGNIFGKLCSG